MFPLQKCSDSAKNPALVNVIPMQHTSLISPCIKLLLFLVTIFVSKAETSSNDKKNQATKDQPTPPRATVVIPPQTGAEIAQLADATSLSKASKKGMKVLILGDSMALSGFADTLDQCLRSCPGVTAVHTVICCGTNPLSWLKTGPYAQAKTRCGFLEIQNDGGERVEIRDIYGMKKGHKPDAHPIPKIDDLVSKLQPDIIVFQSGNNFFDLFNKGEVIDKKSGSVIRAHISPLVTWMISSAPSVKKWYWVTPPQAGNVTTEVQTFLFDSIKENVDGYAVMVDSREITHYPYPIQDRDRMHFSGQASHDWGRDSFRLICKDLAKVNVPKLPSLVSVAAAKALVTAPVAIPVEEPPTPAATVRLRAKLVATSKIPRKQDLTTYGEYLAVYLYDVLEVKSGTYEDSQLLLWHPAYIQKEEQDLSRYKIGKEYEMEIAELDEISLWATTRRSPENENPDLIPYMLVDDINRHPDAKKQENTALENIPAP